MAVLRVEYWVIPLANLEQSPNFWPLLDHGEQARALGFKFPELQQRFVLARGVLRQILGVYLQRDPKAIAFHYGDHGKPFVPGISFNLAHTQTLALCAVAPDCPQGNLGVDIEKKKRRNQVLGLVKRFFTAAEFDFLQQLPETARQKAFLQLWTAKEAYLKGLGLGLQGGLDRVQVQLTPTPQFITSNEQPWSLHLFEPDLDHFGAIAIDQTDCQFTNRGRWMI
ncbi:4'-phosphopantetheinyl transferase [[Synechococcus] sp. NIES-970]|nr:4'-phosphopantetheinyl transferase [[Synechococcus] sp. NIES-970]